MLVQEHEVSERPVGRRVPRAVANSGMTDLFNQIQNDNYEDDWDTFQGETQSCKVITDLQNSISFKTQTYNYSRKLKFPLSTKKVNIVCILSQNNMMMIKVTPDSDSEKYEISTEINLAGIYYISNFLPYFSHKPLFRFLFFLFRRLWIYTFLWFK